MNNPNAGQKARIPMGTSSRPLAPSAPPVSEKTKRIISHVEQTVNAADFSPPSAPAVSSSASLTTRQRRKTDSKSSDVSAKKIMKGIYLDPAVCDALKDLKRTRGQIASVFVNNLLRKELGL